MIPPRPGRPGGAEAPEFRARLQAFIVEQTRLASPPLLPELSLHLACEVTPLWRKTEADLAELGIEPPYWAFAWAGGQAVARHVLDHPTLVRGRRVLDVASGSGVCAIAAALAGASEVVAVDVDPLAVAAIELNAESNGVRLEARLEDLLAASGPPAPGFEVVLAGDVFYDRAMAARMEPFLRRLAALGLVLVGDPGRAYLPGAGLTPRGNYDVPTLSDVEAGASKRTSVFALGPG